MKGHDSSADDSYAIICERLQQQMINCQLTTLPLIPKIIGLATLLMKFRPRQHKVACICWEMWEIVTQPNSRTAIHMS